MECEVHSSVLHAMIPCAFSLKNTAGTDDDFPPSSQNRISIGISDKGKRISAVNSTAYSGIFSDMEAQIHHLEQEAYSAVLRAFKAQSDAITWEKESLITELRKELRVSDDEHRELLTRVNGDDIIRRIREWRQGGEHQASRFNATQPIRDVSSSVLASRKKQKTSQMSQSLPGLSSMKAMPYPSTGPTGYRNFTNSIPVVNEHAEATTCNPLIGRKVLTRWPEDNNFYEAVITDYNPVEGRHALVYDINTATETWEWVDLKEIPPEDIQWEGDDPGISYRGGYGGLANGVKKSMSSGGFFPSAGRGREPTKSQSKPASQNGFARKLSDDIELLKTDTLVKEVERIFGVSHPDPLELEKAKKMLKEHEQALVDAIARLAYASDDESDGERQLLQGPAMEQE